MMSTIADNKSRSWANNEVLLADVRSARSALEAFKAKSIFWEYWTVNAHFANYCRKIEPRAALTHRDEMNAKDIGLKALIERQMAETNRLKAMRAARNV